MTWPTIPPEYVGRTFRGSRFPGYDDPAFADFQRAHVERMALDVEQALWARRDDHCPTHRRALTPRELKAGVCFWCRPDRYLLKPRGALAIVEPSEIDDPDAQDGLF